MRAHFRHLRFKSFPMVWRAQQSIETCPFNSPSEISGVHQDSSQNGSCLGSVNVSVHSLTLPRTSLNSREYVVTPELPSNAFAFVPRLPFFWLATLPCLYIDSRVSFLLARNLATSCLGREPKARVATCSIVAKLTKHIWWFSTSPIETKRIFSIARILTLFLYMLFSNWKYWQVNFCQQ
jgi:hypothetical protein